MLYDDDLIDDLTVETFEGGIIPGIRGGMRDGMRDGFRRDGFHRFPKLFPRRRFFPVPIVITPGVRPCFTYDRFGRCCDRFGRCCDRFGRCDFIDGFYDGFYPAMASYDDMDDDFI